MKLDGEEALALVNPRPYSISKPMILHASAKCTEKGSSALSSLKRVCCKVPFVFDWNMVESFYAANSCSENIGRLASIIGAIGGSVQRA